MSKLTDSMALPIIVRDIMERSSDAKHPISLAEIQNQLSDYDFSADRRTLYKVFRFLNDSGCEIVKYRDGKYFKYYFKHVFEPEEILILLEGIESSSALSKKQTKTLQNKLEMLMSIPQIQELPEIGSSSSKPSNNDVLKNIALLMGAIKEKKVVKFKYYDWGVNQQKQYRRNGSYYELTPYAFTTNDGKFYCIFYSEKHQDFSLYRLDKIDHLRITDQITKTVQFKLEDYIRKTFDMYSGDAQTITGEFANAIYPQMFDQFGKNIIIRQQKENTFIASIRTAITPTLRSWIILFQDQITITSPQSLIDELKETAQKILKQYEVQNHD